MARPVCKGFVEIALISLLQRIRPRRCFSLPRWRYARPGPHKTLGVDRRFLNQDSRAPFDCQAISSFTLSQTCLVDRLFRAKSTDDYAGMDAPSASKRFPRRKRAQAIRASLLAKATTATL